MKRTIKDTFGLQIFLLHTKDNQEVPEWWHKTRDINLLVKIYCIAFNTIPFDCNVLLLICFSIIKHALKSFLQISFRVCSQFSFIILMALKQWPLRSNFNHSNKKKSHSAISGEYRAFGAVFVEYFFKNSLIITLWDRKWCKTLK